MANQTDSFSDIIERAQAVSNDVGGPFGNIGGGRVAFQPGQAPGVPEFSYEANMAVFNLPHDAGEYEEVLNQCLSGRAIIRFEEKTFDKDGNFMVAICYLTPRERGAQQQAAGDAGDHEPMDRPQRLA